MTSQAPENSGPSTEYATPSGERKLQGIVRQARQNVGDLLEALENERLASPTRDSTTSISKNVLKAFSSSEAVSMEKFRNSGGLKSIMASLRKFPKSSGVVSAGCSALGALTILDSDIQNEIAKFGGIEVIVEVVSAQGKQGTDDARVAGIKILRNLTQTEENRAAIFKAKGLEGIIGAMKNSSSSPRTLSHASLVLSNLAFGNAEIKIAAGELGGIAEIVKGMREHLDYQAMQARGSLALRNLCYGSDGNQSIAGEAGAAEALLKAIEGYLDDREVVHQSCVALANLSNESVPNRGRIVAAGGAGTAVRLMLTYRDSLTVHDDAISIVRNISVDSSEAQLEVGASGGIGCIVMAIEKFKDAKLIVKACSAIRYLCFLSENRERIREERGIEKMVGVLRTHGNDVSMTENALLAIGNATFEHVENKAAVGRCGGITAIIKVIEQHRLSERIQEHGCRVLRNLVDGYELNGKILGENGGIKTAVFAMMGYAECASVQEQACAMLLNIVLCEEFIVKVEQSDVRRLAEKAIGLHGKHRGVLLQAGTLIDKLNGHDVVGMEEEQNAITPKRSIMRKLTKKMSKINSRS